MMEAWREKSLWEKCELALYTGVVALIAAWSSMPSPPPETVMINKRMYNKNIIVSDFIDAAVSAQPWNFDDERRCPNLVTDLFRDDPAPEYVGADLGDEKGWWRKYMTRGDGWPKKCVLHKWGDGEIRVAVDWPPVGPVIEFPHQRPPVSAYSAKQFESYNIVESHVRTVIPYLERATGRKVTLVPAGDESEYGENHAQIRIVPIDKPGFKVTSREYPGLSFGNWHLNSRDYQFWGGVPLTNETRFQVDGYLLPKSDNSLGAVVCKFYPGYTPDLVLGMITECMVRAMGLPETTSYDQGYSVLGPWNQNFYRTYASDVARYTRVSVYDMIMLRILYCPSLKSGMTRDEIASALMKNNDCFESRLPKAPPPPPNPDGKPGSVVPVMNLNPEAHRPNIGAELIDNQKDDKKPDEKEKSDADADANTPDKK